MFPVVHDISVPRRPGMLHYGRRPARASHEIGPDDLVAAGLDDSERVLLRTPNSTGALREAEKSPWVGLSGAAAELLVQRGVRLVGIDYVTIA